MTRYLGTETEYGIATPGDPALSPIVSSTHAVVAYAALHTGARSRWDFEDESPLRDARGFDLRRYHTVPVIDADALGIANVVVDNGARFYVDHAHPEYSSPECSNAWDAMIYDAAGDLVLNQAAEAVHDLFTQGVSVLKNHPPCPPLKLYKNNVDGKGASYGAHENYQYARATDFGTLAQALIPFFVTRQIVIGAGRVGIGERGETNGFQISQRADYFFQEISLETTLNRGIINTRDEPHADASHYRRLHTIVGDANMSQTANFLKLGMTSLVLDAIEAGTDFADLRLVDPISELKAVSRDLHLRHQLRLRDGRELTALEILAAYRARVSPHSDVDKRVLAIWDEVTELLAIDPLRTSHLLDWTAKWALIKGYLKRGATMGDAKVKLIDLQYSDIDPKRSLYHALVRKGRMQVLADAATIATAVRTPPEDSRAWLRGRVMSRFGESVIAASWQSLILHTGTTTVKVPMVAVDENTRAEIGSLIDAATTAADLAAALDHHEQTRKTL